MSNLDTDAIIESLKPQEPFISRRPVAALLKPEPKLYSIIIKNGSRYIVFLAKRANRILAESAARKYVESKPGNEIFGINLVDESRLDVGEIVHIF